MQIMPFIFLVIPLAFVIIILIIKSITTVKTEKIRSQVYLSALEKNEQVPEQWFPSKKSNPLETGIILIALGVAIAILLFLATPSTDKVAAGAIGLIPLFLGFAFVGIHFIKKK